MQKKRYSALCCYFGAWPTYFQFWLSSCKYNESITFFIVTDIPFDGFDVPKNVVPIHMSFAEVQARIHEKFDKDIENYNGKKAYIEVPYKLCEYKAAYGYIFQDFFFGFDYWGFYDIDTIWGNILKFIPSNANNMLVKIFRCGHLCFIKNDNIYYQIYKLVNDVIPFYPDGKYMNCKIKPWQIALSEPNTNFYDEFGGLEPLMKYLGDNQSVEYYHHDDFDNIMPPYKCNHFNIIGCPNNHFVIYNFNNGTLIRHSFEHGKYIAKERAYLHISRRRMRISTSNLEHFMIYPNVFKDYKKISKIDVLWFGRKRYITKTINRINIKIKKLFS